MTILEKLTLTEKTKAAMLASPAPGMIFGLLDLLAVTTGEWCCYYTKTDGVWDN